MKVYFSPCKTGTETIITYVNEDTVNIDGEDYEFDTDSVSFPDIATQTNYKILEARRTDGELFLKVFRGYANDCPWDTGTYQDFKAEGNCLSTVVDDGLGLRVVEKETQPEEVLVKTSTREIEVNVRGV